MLKLRYRDSSADAAWLAEPGITIGSDRVSTLVIDAPGVRGFHADIRVGADGVWIKDVGTDGGTFVNGERIGAETQLRAGDLLTIGRTELEVVDPQDATARDATDAAASVPSGGTDAGDGSWALLALNGPLEGRSFALQPKTIVGRAEECDVSIPEARLSREHAQLILAGELLSIRDLGSSNGTFHNGHRVERALLAVGDTIAFDKMEFRVLGPEPVVADIGDDGFDKTIITTASAEIAGAVPPASASATTGVNPNVPPTGARRGKGRSVSSTGGGSGTSGVVIVALLVLVAAAAALFLA